MSETLAPRPFFNDGGPLIVLPDSAAPHWEGSEPPSARRVIDATSRWSGPGHPATDYDRACDVDPEYAASLRVGDSWGIVLGTEVAQEARWLTTSDPHHFYVVGIALTDDASSESLRQLAAHQPVAGWRVLLEHAAVGANGLLLTHAASRPIEVNEMSAFAAAPNGEVRPALIGDALRFEAPEGSYRVDACDIVDPRSQVLTFVRFASRSIATDKE